MAETDKLSPLLETYSKQKTASPLCLALLVKPVAAATLEKKIWNDC